MNINNLAKISVKFSDVWEVERYAYESNQPDLTRIDGISIFPCSHFRLERAISEVGSKFVHSVLHRQSKWVYSGWNFDNELLFCGWCYTEIDAFKQVSKELHRAMAI